jgi:myo-inositol-1(or 4)-monophosphatase
MDLARLCFSAIHLIKETGYYIRTERKHFNQSTVQHKSVRDLVSYVDQSAERMLVEKLTELLPEAGFITEEKTIEKTGAINWVIDPLDGTTNYITGLPLYSTTLALVRDKEVLVGITYDIPSDHCYYSWKGGGAYCDGRKIHVKENPLLEKSLVIIGTPYHAGARTVKYFDMIRHLYENSLGIRITGSAALDMAYVAAGKADAFIEFNLYPWDIAAGYLLVREAGGYSSAFDGAEDFTCPEIIASGNIQATLLHLAGEFLKGGS